MPTPRHRAWSLAAVAAFSTLLLVGLHLLYFDPLRKAEFYSRDLREFCGRKATLDPRLVYLGIDKASVQLDQLFPDEIEASPALKLMSKGFPWSREVYALVLDRLVAAGARAVIFDLLFPKPGEGDEAFHQALDTHRDRVVLGCDFAFKNIGTGGRTEFDLPIPALIPPRRPLDPRLGFVTFWSDADGVVRRVPFTASLDATTDNDPGAAGVYESLSARALRAAGRGDLLPGPGQRLFRFAGVPGTIPCHSIYELFVPELWQANYAGGSFFKDKIVMVGPEGGWSHDEHATPFRLLDGVSGLMAGPEIHLQALNAALHSDYLRELPPAAELALFVAAGALAFTLGLVRAPLLRIGLASAGALAYVGASQALFSHAGIFLPLAAPIIILGSATMFSVITDFRRERAEKAKIRGTLERYVGENVVTEILANPRSYLHALGGVRKEVTVLFSDLRDFTAMTANRDPAELVAQLNEYFSAMMEHVIEHNGTVDKIMGDGLMAVWGNLHSEGTRADALSAVRAALAMRATLGTLNAKWVAVGWPEFRFGIGLAHGEALVGNIGSTRKMDFTAIGDVINTASRIEQLTVRLDHEILIGEVLARLVGDGFDLRSAGSVSVKGKAASLHVFGVERERVPAPANRTATAGVRRWRGLPRLRGAAVGAD